MRLVQSTIVTETIIITGKGVPDYATRLFLKLLSDRYYNIPIEGIESLDNETCYGNMDLNLSIDEVLEAISHTVSLSYRREGNKIIVYTQP